MKEEIYNVLILTIKKNQMMKVTMGESTSFKTEDI